MLPQYCVFCRWKVFTKTQFNDISKQKYASKVLCLLALENKKWCFVKTQLLLKRNCLLLGRPVYLKVVIQNVNCEMSRMKRFATFTSVTNVTIQYEGLPLCNEELSVTVC